MKFSCGSHPNFPLDPRVEKLLVKRASNPKALNVLEICNLYVAEFYGPNIMLEIEISSGNVRVSLVSHEKT